MGSAHDRSDRECICAEVARVAESEREGTGAVGSEQGIRLLPVSQGGDAEPVWRGHRVAAVCAPPKFAGKGDAAGLTT